MEALSRRNAILRRRLLRAFPEMRSTRYELALERMREALRKKKNKLDLPLLAGKRGNFFCTERQIRLPFYGE